MSGYSPDALLPELERSALWPDERLRELQLRHLRRLLEHAGQHVPFYRDLFPSIGFSPAHLRSLGDLAVLPILGKSEIMPQCERFISETALKPLRWLRTSGSTGNPFQFVLSPLAQSYKIANRVRFRHWFGIDRCDSQLILGGIPAKPGGLASKVTDALHDYATHRYVVYASDMTGEGLERTARLIEERRVRSIRGYPTGIADLADYVGRRGLSHSPVAVFTNSETLTSPLRQRIRAGFGVEPRSEYVATEGCLAFECEQGSHHVPMEESLVELVPSSGGDDHSQVVVTFLHTFDFPLIRYRIGDVARWRESRCPCGRALAALDGVVGRFSDAILLPDGRRFTAANINMRIAHYPFIRNIRQYQIAQRDGNALELRVLDAPATDGETVEAFVAALAVLFQPMTVSAVRVAELPRESSGKFRPVVGLN